MLSGWLELREGVFVISDGRSELKEGVFVASDGRLGSIGRLFMVE